MLTKFGSELRKIRLDRNMLLGEMAKMIGVSPAFASAIENGKKNIPGNYIEKISEALNLNASELGVLKKAAELSQKVISFDVYEAPTHNKEVLMAFARRFKSLEADKANEILKLLEKEEDG